MPAAVAHSQRQFFSRMVRACYNAIAANKRDRVVKRAARKRGDAAYTVILKRRYLRARIQLRTQGCRLLKDAFAIASPIRSDFESRVLLTRRFIPFTFNNRHFKKSMSKALATREGSLAQRGFKQLISGVVKARKWRVMNVIAVRKRNHKLTSKTYHAWTQFKVYKRNMGAIYYRCTF